MNIIHSPKITELLTTLAKRKQLKYARPLALYVTTSNTAAAEELVKLVCNKHYPDTPNMVRGVATTSDTSFFFDKPEAQVIEEIQAIKPRRKGKTAPKVIVKMIYTRLVNLWTQIEKTRAIKSNDPKGYYTGWVVPILTRETLVADMTYDNQGVDWETNKTAEELGAILARDDITDTHIDEAWGLLQTHIIMNS